MTCAFLGKTLLAFALLHSVLQGKFACYSRCFLISYFVFQSPMMKRMVLVLKGLVGLHRTVHLQLLQHYWLGHKLGLPWYWMVCLGNEQRSFCRFWDCTQVLHFGLFCWPWGLLHFFWGIPAQSSRYDGHLSYIHTFQSILVPWFLKWRRSLLPYPLRPLPICLDLWT